MGVMLLGGCLNAGAQAAAIPSAQVGSDADDGQRGRALLDAMVEGARWRGLAESDDLDFYWKDGEVLQGASRMGVRCSLRSMGGCSRLRSGW